MFASKHIERGTPVLSFLEGSQGPLSRLEVKWTFPATEAPNALQVGQDGFLLLSDPQVFVNHSCNPNAGIDGNLNLVARRDIPAGREILWDYSTTMDEDGWTMEGCRCGSYTCRGTIRDFKTLPRVLALIYCFEGLVPGYCARHFGQPGWRYSG